MDRARVALAVLGTLSIGCRNADSGSADLVMWHGMIATVDSARPEVEALAVVGDRIVAVGTDDDITPYIGARTAVIDLQGRRAVPGFIEGHGHFLSLGMALMTLDLSTATTWDEIVQMVARVTGDAPRGTWIVGHGWHQEKWTATPPGSVEGVPTHQALSAVSPNNPVLLTHASGHAAFVNANALALAGIDRNTPDPPGGEIVHDPDGQPTGLLRETAQRLVEAVRDSVNAMRDPGSVRAEQVRAVELAGAEALSHGVTSFQDAGAPFALIDLYRELAGRGALPVRLYVMVRYETNETMAERLPPYRMIGEGNGFLTVRSIKRQIDGALGSHGAWLLAPYEDLPSSTGLVLEPVADIARTAEIAIENGFQLNTHAIGDRANREVLNIYERAFTRAGVDGGSLRWRIEHAQHIDPADLPRFARLGVIASMQGIHERSDAPWVFKRLGAARAESGAYLWRSLIDSGVIVTNGTDVPVERIDPIPSFYASVTRRAVDGSVFFPAQRMTRDEALRSYTINAAYAAFEEQDKGSLVPGKLADIVVLSRDIMTIPDEQIPGTTVDLTIVGGRVRYRAGGES